MLAAQAAPAQTAGETSGIDIPDNVQILGKMDPNKRRATAKVNGEIITGTDVEQRVALIVAANEGTKIAPEEMQRLRMQVLRNLIDETLEIQEAKAQDMAVTKQEVDEYY
ncbi:MAG: SurA N-terminal domain-containing protein, partial [Planctomycetes bacterium]|nr:SurA N-terminal domain-containing protein [Planctomycetota bacterium]